MRTLAALLVALGVGLVCLSGGVSPPHFKSAHAQTGPLVGTGPMAPTCPSPYGGNNSQTVSLLHMDGANGATSVTDYAYGAGASPLSWTFGGGAALSTSSPKFGSASLSLASASSSYITTPSNALFNALGTTPFVVDMWINSSTNGTRQIFAGVVNSAGQGTSESFLLEKNTDNTFTFEVSSGTTAYDVTTAGTVTSAGWHHIAGIANGTDIYIELDGTMSSGTAYTSIVSTTNNLSVGRVGAFNADYWNGNIDEFRITVGSTRGWTTNFPVPTTPYC